MKYGESAYVLKKRIFGDNYVHTANATLNLSSALIGLTRYEDAEKFINRAIMGYKAVDLSNLNMSYQNLNIVYKSADRKAEAEALKNQRNKK